MRKRRKTTITEQIDHNASDPDGAQAEGHNEASSSQRPQQGQTPIASTLANNGRTVETSPYQLPEVGASQPAGAETSQLPHDPGTGSSTYIGRSHCTGDAPADEAAARAYAVSRHTGLSDIEQKTLELCNVYALPPRAVE